MRASTQLNGLTASILIVFLCTCAATTHAQISFSSPQPAIELSVAGSYSTDDYDNSAAEIVAYDEVTENLYVTNSSDNALDVLSIANSLTPSLVDSIDLSDYGAGPNSVAISAGLIAVAVEADPAQEPGSVVFFNRAGDFLAEITVGPLPDMLVFTPNGEYLLVANEGEPDDDYVNDPEGSISIIEIASQQSALASSPVAVAGFAAFNNVDISPVRVFGPGASVAQDLEPEFIAVSADSQTAWVTLQENNGIAIIDIQSATVTDIVPLGVKTFDGANQIDASNDDNRINISAWSDVVGMYQPDAITAYNSGEDTFLIIANEGDARDYDGFSEEFRIGDQGSDFIVDPIAYANIETLALDENLGRLRISSAVGDTDGDGDIEVLHSYGGRSFSILNESGQIVFDSGSDFERITALALPNEFNSTNDENGSFDNRSDDKGPEPEGVVTGNINGRTYAFIGLERVGGVMVYDVTSPYLLFFVQYINNRDFQGDAESGTAGDLGPEGLLFIPATRSPTNEPLLVVTNKVSGSTTTYRIVASSAGDPGIDDQVITITASVFADTNANGLEDSDETGRANIPVSLFRCEDSDGLVATQQTAANSGTQFSDLEPGRYQLAFTLPSADESFVSVFDSQGELVTPVRSSSSGENGELRGFTSCLSFAAGSSTDLSTGVTVR